jgi:hypothetical protein
MSSVNRECFSRSCIYVQGVESQALRIIRERMAVKRVRQPCPLATLPISFLERAVQTGFALGSAGQACTHLGWARCAGVLPCRFGGIHQAQLPLHCQARADAVIQKMGFEEAGPACPNLPWGAAWPPVPHKEVAHACAPVVNQAWRANPAYAAGADRLKLSHNRLWLRLSERVSQKGEEAALFGLALLLGSHLALWLANRARSLRLGLPHGGMGRRCA